MHLKLVVSNRINIYMGQQLLRLISVDGVVCFRNRPVDASNQPILVVSGGERSGHYVYNVAQRSTR